VIDLKEIFHYRNIDDVFWVEMGYLGLFCASRTVLNPSMRPSVRVQMLLLAVAHAAHMLLQVSFREEDAGAVGAFEEVFRDSVVRLRCQTCSLRQCMLMKIFFPSSSASCQSASDISDVSMCKCTFRVRTSSAISVR